MEPLATHKTSLTPRAVVGAIVLGALAPVLAVVLGVLRPDLMGPALESPAGRLGVGLVLLLSTAGSLLSIVAGIQGTRWGRVGLSIGAFLLCTLPALFIVLFGPVAFAFVAAP